MSQIEQAADRLWKATTNGVACAPVRELIGDDDIDAAYAVQANVSQRRLRAGQRLVGRKIGLTSVAVQTQLEVNQPDFGPLFANQIYADNAEVPMTGLIAPRVEAEVTLVLGQDLDEGAHTAADVIRATDFALASLEIIDSRVRDWDIAITDTIADQASAAAAVLGTRPVALGDLELVSLPMQLTVGGKQRSAGVGAATLGNPIRAAVWLADELVRRGDPLKAGDVVMTGALGPVVPVAAGDEIVATFGSLGQVSCRFLAD